MARRPAKSLLKAAPRKKTVRRGPKTLDEKHLGTEPEWDGYDYSDRQAFESKKCQALTWYNYMFKATELHKNVWAWMKQAKYTKTDVAALKALPAWKINGTIGANCTMLLNGLADAESGWVRDALAAHIEQGKPLLKAQKKEEKVQAKAYVPTIQEKMRDKLCEIIGQIEEWDDAMMAGESTPNVLEWLKSENVAQAHIGKIIDYYNLRRAEFAELLEKKPDPQLVEAYAFLKKTQVKKIVAWYDNLLSALDAYAGIKKTIRKTRAKKPVSKTKQVARLKYATEDKETNVASIRSEDIIGAQEVWVYNTRLRKIGIYRAAEHQTIGVKGSGLTGWDEKTSVQKTLRKPQEQLREWVKSGKIKQRKLFEDIRAVEQKLNGRINANIVLLKAV